MIEASLGGVSVFIYQIYGCILAVLLVYMSATLIYKVYQSIYKINRIAEQ